MDVNVKVPAIEKLMDYAASGIGSVAGPLLAPWHARQKAAAAGITAEGHARVLQIQAEAQAKAREVLLSNDTNVTGELDITETVHQRIQFQERKRQANIEAGVRETAEILGDKTVPDIEPDHDWTARYFNEVQDVSSEEMRSLWAKILAGEVEQPGSTSIRTLDILKNMDRVTANLFRKFCSACIFLCPDGNLVIDARVPSLGGNAGSNSLKSYGFSFDALNRLNENGLIISDYNSWFDYRISIVHRGEENSSLPLLWFDFQGSRWILVSAVPRDPNEEFRLSGVALTQSGKELSKVVDLEPMTQFRTDLVAFFERKNLGMNQVLEGSRS